MYTHYIHTYMYMSYVLCLTSMSRSMFPDTQEELVLLVLALRGPRGV